MAKKEEQKYPERNYDKDKKDFVKKDKTAMKDGIWSVIFFFLGAFFFFSSIKFGGKIGNAIFNGLHFVLGWTSYLFFIIFLVSGYVFWNNKKRDLSVMFFIAMFILLISINSLSASIHISNSGMIGDYLYKFLSDNFGNIIPAVISLAVALISFIFIYEDRPRLSQERVDKLKETNNLLLEKSGKVSKNIFLRTFNLIKTIFKKIWGLIVSFFKFLFYDDGKESFAMNSYQEENSSKLHDELMEKLTKKDSEEEYGDISAHENFERVKAGIEASELIRAKSKSEEERQKSIKEESKPIILEGKFIPPDITLLNSDSGKSSAGDSKSKMNMIQKVLDQFSIPVEMGEVTVGPSVTQFTLKPAQGVNVRKILGLKDNLQMALSATNMHIEAPIPGRPFVGIEIPNEKKTILGLRSIVELEEFQNGSNLTIIIGKDIIGRPVISDLTKMPHLLVAGATGAGKSVTLHNLIISLLYKNSPSDLKLIILDPKRVEFTSYSALPHLYTPIIKDAKTAIKCLNWAAQEMERRYDVLGEYGLPNLIDYNKKIFNPALEKARKRNEEGEVVTGLPPKMPFIVIVFDEFNDFMLSYPKEITPIITSLSQKARAAGIHLILTTQRPDVKVITGTIKANIPSRIALKTTSQIDSRTILDQAGAEDLLGNGDMLYMNGSTITRVQAPFVSIEEIKNVINNIKKIYEDFIPDNISIEKIKISSSPSSGYKEMEENSNRSATEEPTDDEDYMSARDYVISTGKASTSALQTAFRWGYNKSARIMNDLEMYGVIGPAASGRHREVLFGKNNESEVERIEKELVEMENHNKDDYNKKEEVS
ncbi:MAG: segregation ATPase FtsK/SpoIIIE, family [Patescibacteria group bacterium]|nr:segregation ATPase FtsK/SpoIIIE, family [Patescibacteria group bacterium]